MKLATQNVPPFFADLYDELITTNRTGSGAGALARTRRGATQSQKPRRPAPQSQSIARIVAHLAKYHRANNQPGIDSAWEYQRRAALKAGNVEPEFWQPVALDESIVLESIPTSTENLAPGPYNYRDPDIRPSTPTYPDGTPSTAEPSHAGAMLGNVYVDTIWRWRRSLFIRDPDLYATAPDAAFLRITGDLRIDTSNRASRPLLSLSSNITPGPIGGPQATDISPPLNAAWRHYWRFDLPATSSPYWHGTLPRDILQELPRGPTATTGPAVSVRCAPAPMLGRGWNNNLTVTTEWIGTELLYEPAPINPVQRLHIQSATGQLLGYTPCQFVGQPCASICNPHYLTDRYFATGSLLARLRAIATQNRRRILSELAACLATANWYFDITGPEFIYHWSTDTKAIALPVRVSIHDPLGGNADIDTTLFLATGSQLIYP